jgi:hypothetical protein
MNPNVHVRVFRKAIHANGEKDDVDIINLFFLTLRDAIFEWGIFFMRAYPICRFEKLEVVFYNHY